MLSKTDLGPAGKTLVEKISGAIGAGWQPLDKILNAYADVKVAEIKAEGEVEATQRRAIQRLIAEETRQQENLEATYGKMFPLLEPSIDPDTIRSIDDDWLVFHSQKARLVSDGEMQTLWAKVLAQEATTPGSFNKRCLNLLSAIERDDAHCFTSLCGFVVHDSVRPLPAIFFRKTGLPDVYAQNWFRRDMLIHLDTIGLIRFSTPLLDNNIQYYDNPSIQLQYFGETRSYQLRTLESTVRKYRLDYGAVQLTDLGEQLSRIAGATPVPGFFDFLDKPVPRLTAINHMENPLTIPLNHGQSASIHKEKLRFTLVVVLSEGYLKITTNECSLIICLTVQLFSIN